MFKTTNDLWCLTLLLDCALNWWLSWIWWKYCDMYWQYCMWWYKRCYKHECRDWDPEIQHQNETDVYSGLMFIKYLLAPTTWNTRNDHTNLTTGSFPAISTAQKRWKSWLTDSYNAWALTSIPHGRLATPLRNVKYMLNCHTHCWHLVFIWDSEFIYLRTWYTPGF